MLDRPLFIYTIDFITVVVALPLYICMIMSVSIFIGKITNFLYRILIVSNIFACHPLERSQLSLAICTTMTNSYTTTRIAIILRRDRTVGVIWVLVWKCPRPP